MLAGLVLLVLLTQLIATKPFLEYFEEIAEIPEGVSLMEFNIGSQFFPLDSKVDNQALEECARKCMLEVPDCFYFTTIQDDEEFGCHTYYRSNFFEFPNVRDEEKSVILYGMPKDPAFLNEYFKRHIESKSAEQLESFLFYRYRVDETGGDHLFLSFLLRIVKDAVIHRKLLRITDFGQWLHNPNIGSTPMSKTDIEERRGLSAKYPWKSLSYRSIPGNDFFIFMLDFIQIVSQQQPNLHSIYDPARKIIMIHSNEMAMLVKISSNNQIIMIHKSSKSDSSSFTQAINDDEIRLAFEEYSQAMNNIGLIVEESKTKIKSHVGKFVDVSDILPVILGFHVWYGKITVTSMIIDILKAVIYEVYNPQNDNEALQKSRLFHSRNVFSDLIIQ